MTENDPQVKVKTLATSNVQIIRCARFKGISQTPQSIENRANYQNAYLCLLSLSINTAAETPHAMLDSLEFCSELLPDCQGPKASGNGEG